MCYNKNVREKIGMKDVCHNWKKGIFAGITASILALSCATQVPAILSASAAGNYEMQLNIKLNGEKKAISPYIYGVNEAGNSTSLKKAYFHVLSIWLLVF